MAKSIDPGASKDRFWIKKQDFWDPFWHRFFDIFKKRRKCEISEEYNAKRGSEPSKTFHFRIDFSSNFHVFSEPPSRGHFWRVQAPVYTQKCDFGAIFDFPGVAKATLETTFWPKNVTKNSARFPPDRSWSRAGRNLASKTLQGRIFIDLGTLVRRFWKDFASILVRFSKICPLFRMRLFTEFKHCCFLNFFSRT